ncbi:MAG: Rnase Y domain-containing protein, partial [Oscillospiraceae bacterium]|nr:Rnase Y domain-containing protein [Oscillospiraceae bacterium]
MPESVLFYGISAAVAVVAAIVFFFLGIVYRKKVSEREIQSAEEKAKRIINDSIKGAENKKREALLEAKEEIHRNRSEYEREVKERRTEIQKQERRLQQKEEMLDKKTEIIERKTEAIEKRQADLEKAHEEVNAVKRSQFEMLEKISGYTVAEAKAYLIKNLESEVTHEAAMKIKEIEERLKEEADNMAREQISLAIQRCAADHVAEATVS